MKYVYDGTFEGFLSTLFDAYKIIEKIEIIEESDQIDFFEDVIRTQNSEEKAQRVADAIKNKISKYFFREVSLCHLSKDPKKDTVIARVIKSVFQRGLVYMSSVDANVIGFKSMIKNILSENHTYKGLLRFKKIQNSFLFAQIEPDNDILQILVPHFINRLPREKFIIYDVGRKYCAVYCQGEVRFLKVEDPKIIYDNNEDFIEEAWKNFYNSVRIDNRRNIRLMKTNMPIKYWKYLPERR
ncbi:MAG: TIGR03915 family putative DNA repair protein [Peptoniphilus sp.]|nr:TIGR03915 family putative DNA repair protein [Peptoniphilus sp.]